MRWFSFTITEIAIEFRDLAPSGYDVSDTTPLTFFVHDLGPLDWDTLNISVNGAPVVEDGQAVPGHVLTVDPGFQGGNVTVTGHWPTGRQSVVSVSIHDLEGYSASTSWSFSTQALIPSIRTVARDSAIHVLWSFHDQQVVKFVLRRSTETFPTQPEQGHLVYEGPNLDFDDQGLVNDLDYFYSLFTLRSPDPQVWAPRAGIMARAKAMPAQNIVIPEYIPVAQEFGLDTHHPLPNAALSSSIPEYDTWTNCGSVIAPFPGTVVIDGRGIKITNQFGISMHLSPVQFHQGQENVKTGQRLGTALSTSVTLSLSKADGQGRIDPKYFYVVVEKRH